MWLISRYIILYIFLFDTKIIFEWPSPSNTSIPISSIQTSYPYRQKYRFNIIINSTYEDDIQLILLRYMYLYRLPLTSNIQISVTSSIAVASVSCSYNTSFCQFGWSNTWTITCKRFSYVAPIMSIIYLKCSQHRSHTIFLSIRSATFKRHALWRSTILLRRNIYVPKSRYVMVF